MQTWMPKNTIFVLALPRQASINPVGVTGPFLSKTITERARKKDRSVMKECCAIYFLSGIFKQRTKRQKVRPIFLNNPVAGAYKYTRVRCHLLLVELSHLLLPRCIYIYMYLCVSDTHVHIYIYRYKYKYFYKYKYRYKYKYKYRYVYVYICLFICVHIYLHRNANTHTLYTTYIQIYREIQTQRCVCVHIYTYINIFSYVCNVSIHEHTDQIQPGQWILLLRRPYSENMRADTRRVSN